MKWLNGITYSMYMNLSIDWKAGPFIRVVLKL